MFHEIIPRFGTPRMIINDGGSDFIDKNSYAFCLIRVSETINAATPYHHKSSSKELFTKKPSIVYSV
jgi:hypothetical protein